MELKDVFSPTRHGGSDASDSWPDGAWSAWGSGLGVAKIGQLQRLDRLEEVASLALEDRDPGEEWGCADIGTDHGLLAIYLHSSGVSVVAGDKAEGPLEAARDNVRSYLRHTQARSAAFDAAAEKAAGGEEGGRGSSGCECGGRGYRLPSLECRLGDGLAVLRPGEVDTVCIAGIGVRSMIAILSARVPVPGEGRTEAAANTAFEDGWDTSESTPALNYLGIRRLVLQPMDARLEYVYQLRAWLRRNGWRINQEAIKTVSGKGGRRAFLTLRADLASSAGHMLSPPAKSSLGDAPSDSEDEDASDWLGAFLPGRTTEKSRLPGPGRGEERREAQMYLTYLRHQREWLRAIERARPSDGNPGVGDGSREGLSAVAAGVDRVAAAIEDALGEAGEARGWSVEGERLAQARRFRKGVCRFERDSSRE